MARVRKILRIPTESKNFFLIDSNFLVNKFLPLQNISNIEELKVVEACQSWWVEIDKQLEENVARIYIPDICIAETFKVLSKKRYRDNVFRNSQQYSAAKKKLKNTIHTPPKELTKAKRKIKYHDISTNRDIIISVDRFFELFHKHKKNVSIPDLIIVATAKYLIDFYDLPKDYVHIITMDKPLSDGSKKITELPNAYYPKTDTVSRIFV